MPTFKITLAYDGTDFVGWQRQATGVSIQGLLEDALRELDGRDVAVTGAGRTDAGVHALGQVAAFTLERALAADAVVRALNARLPDACACCPRKKRRPSFHARVRRAVENLPLSHLERRRASARSSAATPGTCRARSTSTRCGRRRDSLEGRHDFAAFQAAGSDVAHDRARDSRSRIRQSRSADPTIRNPHPHPRPTRSRGDRFPAPHGPRPSSARWSRSGEAAGRSAWMARRARVARSRGRPGRRRRPQGLFLVSVEYVDALAVSPKTCTLDGLLLRNRNVA